MRPDPREAGPVPAPYTSHMHTARHRRRRDVRDDARQAQQRLMAHPSASGAHATQRNANVKRRPDRRSRAEARRSRARRRHHHPWAKARPPGGVAGSDGPAHIAILCSASAEPNKQRLPSLFIRPARFRPGQGRSRSKHQFLAWGPSLQTAKQTGRRSFQQPHGSPSRPGRLPLQASRAPNHSTIKA